MILILIPISGVGVYKFAFCLLDALLFSGSENRGQGWLGYGSVGIVPCLSLTTNASVPAYTPSVMPRLLAPDTGYEAPSIAIIDYDYSCLS